MFDFLPSYDFTILGGFYNIQSSRVTIDLRFTGKIAQLLRKCEITFEKGKNEKRLDHI